MALLEVKDLESGYGEVQILWGVSISPQEGKLTSLVGGNGAGAGRHRRDIGAAHGADCRRERTVGDSQTGTGGGRRKREHAAAERTRAGLGAEADCLAGRADGDLHDLHAGAAGVGG